MPVNFGGISDERAKEEFVKTQRRDSRKRRLFRKHSDDIYKAFIIKYDKPLTKQYIYNTISEIWE